MLGKSLSSKHFKHVIGWFIVSTVPHIKKSPGFSFIVDKLTSSPVADLDQDTELVNADIEHSMWQIEILRLAVLPRYEPAISLPGPAHTRTHTHT